MDYKKIHDKIIERARTRKLKGYVEVFFTRIGLNDVDSEKFKILSSEIWNKLEELTEVDPKASLAEFTSWAHDKIGQYNR